jgi:hypothetical protein
MKNLVRALGLATAVVGGATTAQAATVVFGDLLSGTGAPASLDFASLQYDIVGSDVNFTLSAYGLDLFAGTTPFIGSMAVDGTKTGSVSNVSGGVAEVELKNGGGPGGTWEFRFNFGQGQDRLTDNELVSWTWVGGASNFTEFALHVQGLNYDGTTSAWYTEGTPPPEVPVPGTLGLLGLGLAGLGAVRRRKS